MLVDSDPVNPRVETSGIDPNTVKKELLRVSVNGKGIDFFLSANESSALLIVDLEGVELLENGNRLEILVFEGGCQDLAGNPFDADGDPENGLQDTV